MPTYVTKLQYLPERERFTRERGSQERDVHEKERFTRERGSREREVQEREGFTRSKGTREKRERGSREREIHCRFLNGTVQRAPRERNGVAWNVRIDGKVKGGCMCLCQVLVLRLLKSVGLTEDNIGDDSWRR